MLNNQFIRNRQAWAFDVFIILAGGAMAWWLLGLVYSRFSPPSLAVFHWTAGVVIVAWIALRRIRLLISKLHKELDAVRRIETQLRESNVQLAQQLEEQAEELGKAMDDAENRFRAMADNAPVMIWMSGPDAQCSFLSEKWLDFTGHSREQEMTNGWAAGVHPEDCERCTREYLDAFESQTVFESEYRLRRADGEYRWVLDRGAPRYLPDGSFAGFVGSCMDITERKTATDALADQAALLDKARDAIMAISMTGAVIYWNKSAERLFGWTTEETIGQPASTLLPGIVSATTWEMLCEKGEWMGELSLRRKDFIEVNVESHKTLVRDKEGHPKSVLIVQTDIGERKKMELKFLRAQRLESVGALANGIAHDLNNILTPLVMSSDLLAKSVTDAEGKKLIEMLQISAQRGGDLVKQIMTFSRGADGEREPVMLKYAIKELATLIRETFPRSICVKTMVPTDLWKVLGNRTQLYQVLMNLAVNARDAMPNGGLLSIETRNVPIGSEQIKPEMPPGNYILLSVTDEGIGMRLEIIDRIFEPFFTTKEPGKGTGLGLSTLIGIVKDHGGFIDVQSVVGKGSCFRVLLPAMVGKIEASFVESSPDLPFANNELILAIDDELAVRKITKLTLESYGYRVLLASDGSEAVSVCAQHKGRIKLVITDTMMRVLDGPATVRALKRIDPSLKFIAVSGMIDADRMGNANYDQDITFLQKPYTMRKLVTAVSAALHPPLRAVMPRRLESVA